MRIRKFAIGLFLLFMLRLTLFPAVAKTELIEIKIWSDKLEYLVREPIVINYSVKNVSDRLVRINLTELSFCLRIRDEKGTSFPAQLSLSYGFAYPDSLKPGEEYKSGVSITDVYGVVSPGEYSCFLENPQGPKEYISPGGKSNTIKVIVKEPEGEEKKVLDMFLEAERLAYSRDKQHGGRDLGKAELGFLKHQQLVNKYPNSIYAALSLRGAIGVYLYSRELNERRKIIPVCKRLIEKYPNSIHFALAFVSLVDVYEVLKDKEGAIKIMQELIKKHPDSKISERAEYWLERIQKWEFE